MQTANSFTFKQSATLTEPLYLGVTNMKFEPIVKGAYGRFYFKPALAGPAKLYGANS